MKLSFISIILITFLLQLKPVESNEVTVTYTGICTDHVKQDPIAFEELALKGKLPYDATVDDLEKYYLDIQSNRDFEVEITSAIKDDSYRIYYYSPKGGQYFYEKMEEWIIHKNQIMTIHHSVKFYTAMNSLEFLVNFDKFFLNVFSFIHPSQYLKTKNSEYQEIEISPSLTLKSWESSKGECLYRIQSLTDSNLSNIPIKTMITMQSNPRTQMIWIAEMSDYQNIDGNKLPSHIKVARVGKKLQTSNETKLVGVEMLMPEDEIDFMSVSVEDLPVFYHKWNLTLADVDTSPIEDSYFWPAVPEGYTYQDKREWTKPILNKPKQERTEEEKNALKGKGLYTFPLMN